VELGGDGACADDRALPITANCRPIASPPTPESLSSRTLAGCRTVSRNPAPSDWVEPEGPMESFGFQDWPGVGVVYAD